MAPARIPKSVANCYRAQESPHKELLLEMRRRILEIIPDAEEVMKYSMPTFILDGQDIAGLKANKNQVGYYPYSGSVISKFPELLEKYQATKGALHISQRRPACRSASKNSRHFSVWGFSSNSIGDPTSQIDPSCRKSTWSATCLANPIS